MIRHVSHLYNMPVCGSADLLFLDLIFSGSVCMVLEGKPKGRDHWKT